MLSVTSYQLISGVVDGGFLIVNYRILFEIPVRLFVFHDDRDRVLSCTCVHTNLCLSRNKKST